MSRRRKRRRLPPTRLTLVTALCLVGLAAGVWAVTSELARITDPTGAYPLRPARSRGPTAAVEGPLAACVTAVQRGAAAVGSAQAVVGDWTAHVRAHTDLQSGRTAEAETNRAWAATGERGPAGVAVFRAADATYRRARDGCLRPWEGPLTPRIHELVACRDVIRQTDVVLEAGRDAVADWAAHLTAMADRRAGRLDGRRALEKWWAATEGAARNIERFDASERVYAEHPSCAYGG